ncbi:helix-turn-helix domain-containing protein [Lacinutrix jangbogonensis]|uniref:helix-turn-helix domain-containing protein n=1 Tax=Lacinutrix jangbogonensis TaxID=1469557 RepID=UPI00053E385E|nr:helix-turn-helix domain-containing protein [Lacinutrix jangbogonensis]
MSNISYQGKFIEQAESFIIDNISNENFGVSELADLMNMSRSNLLRKIKKQTNLSASQFIREIRLQKAAELLLETEQTASEIAFKVGFRNPSYFTKCYREYYGYPPGETKTRKEEEEEEEEETKKPVTKNRNVNRYIIAITMISIIAITYFFKDQFTSNESKAIKEKSVAFLPFKNLSEDNSNLYFINGVMESSLNNLQKIKDLRVISRTSTEKYRNNPKTVSQIAEELGVSYLIEGSGQKIGNEVLLSIQLIDANDDSPIWSEQYKYKLDNVFELQNIIAKKIAFAIEANVTPKELALIEKKPTDNIIAYDYYLKGLEYQQGNKADLNEAIAYFEKAIQQDSKYANAYAQIAICYYYLDLNKIEKKYLDKLNEYADNALLYDSTSELPLIAKALYYINTNEFKLAIPYLEKALDYNPNASSAVLILSNLYARAVPDTNKYLTNALKGIKLNIEANDSVSKSFIYLNLSNALVQNGFAKEASKYIEESLKYNPSNPYAPYLKNFIDYANTKDLKSLTNKMLIEWKKDTTRIDITQDLAKMYYFQEDYNNALFYYEKYIDILSANKIDLYPEENIKIAYTFNKMGFSNKAEQYLSKYKDYLEKDESIYREGSLAMLYLYENMPDKAIEAYNKFSLQDGFQYWVILFFEEDPLLKRLQNHPKYEETIEKIELQFWEKHKKIKETLEKEKLL